MSVTPTEIPDVLSIEPRVFGDRRGFFCEIFQAQRYRDAGIVGEFVQDNVSRSAPGIVRGLHLQHPKGQGKLVWVFEGKVLDVAVDVRVGSPTFGRHVTQVLDAERMNQLYIPAGFAHGFAVLGESPATFAYKCTELYAPEHELAVRWDDPDLGIEWPTSAPQLSDKDRAAPRLCDVDPDRLPRWQG
ncbi:MAG: dTDP-4-dehydrorhamnose 3,5-epimerase [Sandaracinaceae bacterium]